MRVLRDNKESLMAVLEAFVYDPLINWRLMQAEVDVRRQEGEPERHAPCGVYELTIRRLRNRSGSCSRVGTLSSSSARTFTEA